MRTNLYLKVEIDYDKGDTPERIAAELCRNIQKHPTVRRAELMSASGDE